MPSPMISVGGAAQVGPAVENQAPIEMGAQPAPEEIPDGKPGTRTDKDPDELAERSYLDDPWFAKLPPELRSAIRNNANRRPPRGYEDRLQRYFENMD